MDVVKRAFGLTLVRLEHPRVRLSVPLPFFEGNNLVRLINLSRGVPYFIVDMSRLNAMR